MLVEEAGQVLEVHVLASLVPSIQHLILIGDPLQLRPTINTYGNFRCTEILRLYSPLPQVCQWIIRKGNSYTDSTCHCLNGCQRQG